MTHDALSTGGQATVIVADPIHAAGLERLSRSYRVVPPVAFRDLAPNDLAAAAAIIVRTYEVDEPLLQRMPRLRIVAKHGAGVDNIDIAAASGRGVVVANTPGGENATSVAEGAVALMLGTLHRLPDLDRIVRERRYDARWSLDLRNLWRKRLGLVGFGRIAREVVGICGRGFDMRVHAFDPFVSEADMRAAGAEKAGSLDELMAAADVVSVHLPLSAETRHLIGAREIGLMKPGAILVNTARGGLIDEAALIDALRSGRLRGAGLDVFETEPPTAENPLLAMPNVVLSPHAVAINDDMLRDMADRSAALVETCLSGRMPATALNADDLGRKV